MKGYFCNNAKKKIYLQRRQNFTKKVILRECQTITMYLQTVKVGSQLKAISRYYKVKLYCHNFTIYDLATSLGTFYWSDETKTGLQASSYTSCLVNYLKETFWLQARKYSFQMDAQQKIVTLEC